MTPVINCLDWHHPQNEPKDRNNLDMTPFTPLWYSVNSEKLRELYSCLWLLACEEPKREHCFSWTLKGSADKTVFVSRFYFSASADSLTDIEQVHYCYLVSFMMERTEHSRTAQIRKWQIYTCHFQIDLSPCHLIAIHPFISSLTAWKCLTQTRVMGMVEIYPS